MVIYVSDSGIFRSDSLYNYTNTASVNKISPLKPTNESTDSVVREAQKAYVAENTPAYTISISSMGKAAVKSLKSLSEAMNNNNILADKDIKTNITGQNDRTNTRNNNEQSDIYKTGIELDNGNKPAAVANDDDDLFTISGSSAVESEDTSSESSSVNTSNLARYSDFQLQQMLNDGTITRSEYNGELEKRLPADTADTLKNQATEQQARAASQNPVLKQAVQAYNYQMAYQINAAITQ